MAPADQGLPQNQDEIWCSFEPEASSGNQYNNATGDDQTGGCVLDNVEYRRDHIFSQNGSYSPTVDYDSASATVPPLSGCPEYDPSLESENNRLYEPRVQVQYPYPTNSGEFIGQSVAPEFSSGFDLNERPDAAHQHEYTAYDRSSEENFRPSPGMEWMYLDQSNHDHIHQRFDFLERTPDLQAVAGASSNEFPQSVAPTMLPGMSIVQSTNLRVVREKKVPGYFSKVHNSPYSGPWSAENPRNPFTLNPYAESAREADSRRRRGAETHGYGTPSSETLAQSLSSDNDNMMRSSETIRAPKHADPAQAQSEEHGQVQDWHDSSPIAATRFTPSGARTQLQIALHPVSRPDSCHNSVVDMSSL